MLRSMLALSLASFFDDYPLGLPGKGVMPELESPGREAGIAGAHFSDGDEPCGYSSVEGRRPDKGRGVDHRAEAGERTLHQL